MFSYLLLVLLGFGVVARVSRFVTADALTDDLRYAVARRFGPDSKPATLLGCPWCASVWVAAPVAAVATWAAGWPLPGWVMFLGLWLSWSYAYGLLAQTFDAEE